MAEGVCWAGPRAATSRGPGTGTGTTSIYHPAPNAGSVDMPGAKGYDGGHQQHPLHTSHVLPNPARLRGLHSNINSLVAKTNCL